ncbi:hypothetical protein [Saccharomonospora sp. NB11]|jgi:hypothetical protein|uniref:hypothetical protein n=1 Tax=Saccharomonospora sp. NB11 TaxID=1642298 RepID=UPI0018D11C97|nr:hypothetical protein [Saccharomonospora sp. NB11]
MKLIRKAAAVAAIAVGALALGMPMASAADTTATEPKECPPNHVYHPVEGCIPVSPGPY